MGHANVVIMIVGSVTNEEITPMERLLLRHRGWPTIYNENIVAFIRARETISNNCLVNQATQCGGNSVKKA